MTAITIDPTKVRPLLGARTTLAKAGAAMDVGNLVYISDTDDLRDIPIVSLVDADTAAHVQALVGMVVAGNKQASSGAVASGEVCTVCWEGPISLGENLLTENALVYAGNTPGVPDTAAGTTSRVVGFGYTTQILYLHQA